MTKQLMLLTYNIYASLELSPLHLLLNRREVETTYRVDRTDVEAFMLLTCFGSL